MKRTIASFAAAALLPAMGFAQSNKQSWGQFDGKNVYLYTLHNKAGMEVEITNYGGTITSVKVKDKAGKWGDVVLGFDNLDAYSSKSNTSYFGATIGRYGNRIGGGTFTLDGHAFHISTNENGNTLHGGTRGFNRHVWDVVSEPSDANPSLKIHRVSPDGEEGFPGNLDVTVTFTVLPSNELRIQYSAKTDKDTVVNLTNHSYFNLSGPGSGTILDDSIQINASHYTPVNKTLVPTGEIASVAGTPFDFQKPEKIGARIGDNNQQLKFGNGYDHNWVLNSGGGKMAVAAHVHDPKSGRGLEVITDQPGLQFYTGNFLNGSVTGIGGKYDFRSAICLETQHFPDSPNHPNFPSTELKPGQQYSSTTIYKFSVE